MTPSRSRSRLKKVLRILTSLILLTVMLRWIDWNGVQASIRSSNWWYLGLALLTITADRFVMAQKWNLLLRAKGIFVPIWRTLKIYYIGNFLGLFLPPTVGADAVRAYCIAKEKHPLSDVLASIVVERILGTLVLFLFAILGALYFLLQPNVHQPAFSRLLILATILGIAGSLAALLPFYPIGHRLAQRLFDALGRGKRTAGVSAKLESLYLAYRFYGTQKGVLAVFTGLTMLENLLVVVWSYLIGLGLGADLSFLYYVTFVPVVLLLIRLPLSIDGLGIQEGGFAYFFSLAGYDGGLGFGVGLISHIMGWIAVSPGGLFYALDGEARQAVTGKPTDAST